MNIPDRLNLNAFLQPNDSVAGRAPDTLVPWKFGLQQKIQTKSIRTSQVNIGNFIPNSNLSSGTVGVGNGTSVSLTATLANNAPHQQDPNFANPFWSIYQGTGVVGSLQIFPEIGPGIANGKYAVYAGFNYSRYDGTKTAHTVTIANNTGGSQTLFYQVQYKTIQFNSGTQS